MWAVQLVNYQLYWNRGFMANWSCIKLGIGGLGIIH